MDLSILVLGESNVVTIVVFCIEFPFDKTYFRDQVPQIKVSRETRSIVCDA